MNAEEVRILRGAFRHDRRKRPCVAMLTADDGERTVTDERAVIDNIDGNSVTVRFSLPVPKLSDTEFSRITLLLMDGLISKNVCSGLVTEFGADRDTARFSTADVDVLLQDKDAIKPSRRRKKKADGETEEKKEPADDKED